MRRFFALLFALPALADTIPNPQAYKAIYVAYYTSITPGGACAPSGSMGIDKTDACTAICGGGLTWGGKTCPGGSGSPGGSTNQIQYRTGSGTFGGTAAGTLVDSNGDGTLDSITLLVGSPNASSSAMAIMVDGGTGGADRFLWKGNGDFSGDTDLILRSTGSPEIVAYQSDYPAGTAIVTTNTNQTSGLSGNKTWSGTHIFQGTSTFGAAVQVNAAETHAADIAMASTHGSGAGDGTTYWMTGPANNPPSATAKWRFGFKGDSDFASENDPLAILCWNCGTNGSGRQDTGKQQWSLQMEANFKTDDDGDGTVDDHASEFILSYTNPSGSTFRPVFIHGAHDGAKAGQFEHDFWVDSNTQGLVLTPAGTIINGPVSSPKSYTGTLDASGKTALTLAVTQANTNDATTGAWYGMTADCNISGAASSGSPGCQGIRGAATWSNGNGGTKLHGDITAGSFIASITRTGSSPTIDSNLSIKGFETGWSISGTNSALTFGYGADVLSPAAFGSGSSVTYTAGIRVRDQKGLGASQSDALTFDAQTGGSGSKGNLVMDGGNWNDGHLWLGRGATGAGSHFWFDATNGKMRLKNVGAPSSETDGGTIITSPNSTVNGPMAWAAASTSCTTACSAIQAMGCQDAYPAAGGAAVGCASTTAVRNCLCK